MTSCRAKIKPKASKKQKKIKTKSLKLPFWRTLITKYRRFMKVIVTFYPRIKKQYKRTWSPFQKHLITQGCLKTGISKVGMNGRVNLTNKGIRMVDVSDWQDGTWILHALKMELYMDSLLKYILREMSTCIIHNLASC